MSTTAQWADWSATQSSRAVFNLIAPAVIFLIAGIAQSLRELCQPASSRPRLGPLHRRHRSESPGALPACIFKASHLCSSSPASLRVSGSSASLHLQSLALVLFIAGITQTLFIEPVLSTIGLIEKPFLAMAIEESASVP